MSVDVVCAESELSIASNSIAGYADFLARSLESYIGILNEVALDDVSGIQVSVILSGIAQTLSPYKNVIVDKSDDVAISIKKCIEDIAAVDNFQFPTDITSIISAVLGRFL